MKTSKRKRSSKAASVAEASGVDVIAAEASVAAEPVVEAVAEVAAESVADVSNEAAVEQAVEVAAEPVSEPIAIAEASAEPAAEAVVTEAAVVGDPIVVLAANCSVKDAAALKTSLCAFSNHGDAVT